MNQPKDNYKNIKRKGDENPYSNPDVRAMNNNYNNHKSPKLINFLNNDNFEEDIKFKKVIILMENWQISMNPTRKFSIKKFLSLLNFSDHITIRSLYGLKLHPRFLIRRSI
jgi:hypothetical protein